MAELGGLILGLPGLVVACADLYKLTVASRNFDHDVQIVVCKAAVQQMRFAYWLQSVGFVQGTKPTAKLPLTAQKAVKGLLESVQATLKLLADLINEYELPGEPSSVAGMSLPEPFWRLRVSGDKPTSSSMRSIIFHSTTKPIKWATAQQERAEKLVNDLQSLNEGLDWVSGNLANTSTEILPSRMLPHVWGQNNLQTFIEATAQYEPEFAKCAEMKWQVIAATKANITAGQTSAPRNRSPLLVLPTMLSERRKGQSSHMAVAQLKDKVTGEVKPVLLEDKCYAGASPEYEQFVRTRVSETAMMLAKSPKPGRMRVLDCTGFTQSRTSETFSLIFRFPEHAKTDTDPVSLKKLLPQGPAGWTQRHQSQVEAPQSLSIPSLRARFAMAQSLCHSVSLLQACGVLHKAITTSNILFFQSQASDNIIESDLDLGRPIITGFTWARMHGSKFISEGVPSKDFASTSGLLQAHPAYSFNFEQRYLKIFDLYSLGLVLLQIGLWRGIGGIADELFPGAKSSINTTGSKLDETLASVKSDQWLAQNIAEWQDSLVKRQRLVDQSDGIAAQAIPRQTFQDALVRNIQKLLLGSMGDTYTKVVARCLTGDIENEGLPQDIVDAESDEDLPDYILQDAIVKNIVEEIGKCSA
ncbi:hypothetical protein FDECE_13158 [Fusarium decemcellulare]|nr:hypothetical protein FDECE_13158 [Fusarium decemcellulare]